MIYKQEHIFWAKLISIIVSPYYKFYNFFRKKHSIHNIDIKTILITEYHRIGDIIIIAPILKLVKETFPDAHIILICNKVSENLVRHLKLADTVFGINAPWTNWEWSIFKWWKTRSFARSLRAFDVDIGIDFKGDIRNSWFLWQTNPKISFGYSVTGGEFFFTNPKLINQDLHQYHRAIELIKNLGLVKLKKEKRIVKHKNKRAIIFHPGASQFERTWPDEHWVKLAKLMRVENKITIVKFGNSNSLIKKFKKTDLNIDFFEGDLISLFEWLKRQRYLIAPDSMAGHLASYVGIPVLSLFGSQDPNLVKPTNTLGEVVVPDKECHHSKKHWRLCSYCMSSITPQKVFSIFTNHITSIERIL